MIYLREIIAGLVSPFVVGSPRRFAVQLRKFAHTELYTFYDIGAVAARQEGEVRAEMQRHASDEYRHYHAFREWASHVSPYVGANYGDPEGSRGLDEASVAASVRAPAAPNLRLSGFGEYMMYLFLSESRAVLQFQLTRLLNPWNERVWKQIPVLLVDEKRHVRYSLGHSLAELRRRPWATCKGFLRVLGYILRQDLIDLAKLIQTVGSGLACFVLYYGIVTPYALCLRLFGAVRRDRIRSWRARGPARLDAGFWRESSVKVVGISAHFHDAAAALAIDGAVVAAAQEERFSRRKGDSALPVQAFAFCLEQAGLAASDLDAVVFYEKPFQKFYRIVAASLANAPFGFHAFRGALHSWFERKLWIQSEMARAFGVPRARIAFGDHHLSHAAAAFLTEPLESAATLVVDGVGEWTSTTIGRLRRDKSGLAYEVLDSVDFPHSLGLFYSALTAYLGFEVNEGEYKVMGLAPYGKPVHAAALRGLLRTGGESPFALDLSYFAHDRSVERGWSPRLEALLGPPNPPRRPIRCVRGDGHGPPVLAPDFQRFADVAASLQLVLEEELLRLARRAAELSGERVLCYGGGVALNCVANGKLARSGIFERICVHPAAGDAGGALGCALAYSFAERPELVPAPFTPYLGLAAEPAALAADPDALHVPDAEAFSARVAELLVQDRVVGWLAGRAEWGPRALGARSILARPDTPVKHREDFRPFAPVVLAEHAERVFEGFSPGRALERHMLATVQTRPAWRERLAAVTHVDGSARVQVLERADAPLLHRVLERFHAATGLPVLVNTSFNDAGEPIVNDLADAVRTLERCKLDALAAFPYLRERQLEALRGSA